MKNRNKEHLNRTGIVLAIIVVVLIIMIQFYYVMAQRRIIINDAEQVTNQMMEYIASNISSEIGYARSSIILSAGNITQTMTSDTLENPAEIIGPMVQNTPFGNIEYIRADGMNVMNIGEPFDASDRVYYIEGMKGNTGVWNNFHPKTSQETLMNFYTPLMYDGKIAGVITGYIEATSQIAPLLESDLYGQEVYGFLMDENDMIICSNLKTEYVKDLTYDAFMSQLGCSREECEITLKRLKAASEEAAIFKDNRGDGRISVSRVPGTGWTVAVIIPDKTFKAYISENTRLSIIAVVAISTLIIMYAIYILLKNFNKRRAITAEKDDYYETLSTLEGIFYSMHVIDLLEDTAIEFNSREDVKEFVNHQHGAVEMMSQAMSALTTDECREDALSFTDLTTLADRMKDKSIISRQFIGKNTGYFLASFITMEKDSDGRPTKVIYTTRVNDEEKKQEEQLLRASQTDELTGFLNRRAYEEDIYAHNDTPTEDDFIYISLDVNGLKVVNDSLGHTAGDELLIGACQCMKKCLGSYGRLYRTGGDEFVAIIFCNNEQIKKVLADFDNTMLGWKGKLVDSLSISYGWVNKLERPGFSVRQLGAVAEQRMYEAKEAHYRQTGVDRRGQKDAHKALCDLYTKILRINITDDTYQIIDMDVMEQTKEKGFADSISAWFRGFGESGQVHPDDLEGFLRDTDLQLLRDYFKGNKTSHQIFYRRRYEDGFRQVMMELIPTNSYSDDNQSLFLYVKNIDR